MTKAINAHCHIYPAKVARRAVEGIGGFYGIKIGSNGMTSDLIKDGEAAGVVHYLVQSVATSPLQVRSINEFIASEVEAHKGLMTGFGTLHPGSEDLEGDIEQLMELGLKGVKLHPDFQGFAMDSEDAFKLGRVIAKKKLPLLVHCGDPRYAFSNPPQTKAFLERFPDITVIGAHLGGWSVWDEAAELLSGFDNFLTDCSSSLYLMTPDHAKEIIRSYGADRVIWGTDYPVWSAKDELERLRKVGLTAEEEEKILFANAAKLLGIEG